MYAIRSYYAVEPNLTRHYESRDDRDYKSRISHSDESADPGYYRVRLLDPSIEAEKQLMARRSHHRLDSVFGRVDEAIAMATMYTANHLGVKAIAALTESGSTA